MFSYFLTLSLSFFYINSQLLQDFCIKFALKSIFIHIKRKLIKYIPKKIYVGNGDCFGNGDGFRAVLVEGFW